MKEPLAMDGEIFSLVYNPDTGEIESLDREAAGATMEQGDGVKATTAGLVSLSSDVSLRRRGH